MGKANIFGKMVESTLVISGTISWTATVIFCTLIIAHTKANSSRTLSMASASTHGPPAKFTKASGKKANNMEKANSGKITNK